MVQQPYPVFITTSTSYSVDVGGGDVVSYRYAVITGDNTGCAGATYGSEVSEGTDITGSINLPDAQYTICVIAKDSSNNWQSVSEASYHTWTKAFADPTNAATFEPLPAFTAEGIDMSWTAGSNTTGYLLYRQDSGNGDITWAPSNGTTYTEGAAGIGRILYVGTDLSYTDSYLLEDNKTYMYKLFAYNSNSYVEYDSGVQRLSRTYPYMSITSAGSHNCATRFGRLRCWGANTNGVLGYSDTTTDHIGDDEQPYTAGDVNIGKNVLMSTIGEFSGDVASSHACALTEEGKIRCWGDGNSGRLGNNDTSDILPSSFPPPNLAFSDTFIHMGTSNRANCAVNNKGKLSAGALTTKDN